MLSREDNELVCRTGPETPGSNFRDQVRAKAYPVIESVGVLWAYMGPSGLRMTRGRSLLKPGKRRSAVSGCWSSMYMVRGLGPKPKTPHPRLGLSHNGCSTS